MYIKLHPTNNFYFYFFSDNDFKKEHLFSDYSKLETEYEDILIKFGKSMLEDNIVLVRKIKVEKNEIYTVLNDDKYNVLKDSELSGLLIKSKLVPISNLTNENESKCEKLVYICDLCFQSFKSKRKIISHIKKKHDLNNCFSKNVCSKSLKRKQLKKNSFKKTFKCKFCFRQFADQSNCNRHMNHCHIRNIFCLNEGKFKCKVCMEIFTRESNLKVHSRIHTGVLPYECDLCNLKFHRNDALKAHRRIHTNKLIFHCSECCKSFSYKNSLMCHIKIKHQNDKQYVCGHCQLSYSRKQSLIFHLRLKHYVETPF